MSFLLGTVEHSSIPKVLKALVVLIGWAIFLLPLLGLSIATTAILVRFGLWGNVPTPTFEIDSQTALLVAVGVLGMILYIMWQFLNLLKIATFGRERVQKSREEISGSVRDAAENAELLSDTAEEIKRNE